MHADLATRRRVLKLTYERYLEADRAWTLAVRDLQLWFPASSLPGRFTMGDPGSPIRKLYEKRERALLQLEVAHHKLDVAKERLTARQEKGMKSQVFLIAHISN